MCAGAINAGAINAGVALSPGRGRRNEATAAKCAERQYPLSTNKLSELHDGCTPMRAIRASRDLPKFNNQ